MVAGIGTDVGKTIVSAILTLLFKGDYWKPIQCGEENNSDTAIVRRWLQDDEIHVHNPAYSFQHPVSPHHAAFLENSSIRIDSIRVPETTKTLVIEGVGGILVPLTPHQVTLDIFAPWSCRWILVSQHYLGSINHTLLTIEALKRRNIPIEGLIFNGLPNVQSETAILTISKLPCLARLSPEPIINKQTLQKYVQEWTPCFKHLLF